MKKNRTMRIAVVMLALSLITCCFVGSTFAKYTSSATGNDSVQVAKWDIEYNGADITTVGSAQTVSFPLFDTIKDSDGGLEEDVLADGEGNVIRIAPGTSGSFQYTVDNKSDVNAKYSIEYTAVTKFTVDEDEYTVPIEFSVDGTNWKTDITQLNVTDADIAMTDGTATVNVQWRWVIGADAAADNVDTAIGLAAQTASEISVTIAITVEQVD